ncbi:hypothetical protein LINPERPRIM_LOCUS35092 [Linum perenne]
MLIFRKRTVVSSLKIVVEINLNEALSHVVHLDGAVQAVEFENIPTICFACGKVDLSDPECPVKVVQDSEVVPSNPLMGSKQAGGAGRAPTTEGFVLWMVVTRRSSRPQKASLPNRESINLGKGVLLLSEISKETKTEGGISGDKPQISIEDISRISTDDEGALAANGLGEITVRRRKRKFKAYKGNGPSYSSSPPKAFAPHASK